MEGLHIPTHTLFGLLLLTQFLRNLPEICQKINSPSTDTVKNRKLSEPFLPITHFEFEIPALLSTAEQMNQNNLVSRTIDIFVFSSKKKTFNTSYLTDSYISFTLNLESGQNVCSDRSIRSSTYGKKNISDFPPCGKLVIFVNEFVIFLKTSK